jgi:hypothetical protein
MKIGDRLSAGVDNETFNRAASGLRESVRPEEGKAEKQEKESRLLRFHSYDKLPGCILCILQHRPFISR